MTEAIEKVRASKLLTAQQFSQFCTAYDYGAYAMAISFLLAAIDAASEPPPGYQRLSGDGLVDIPWCNALTPMRRCVHTALRSGRELSLEEFRKAVGGYLGE